MAETPPRPSQPANRTPRGLRVALKLSLGLMAVTMGLSLLLRFSGADSGETWVHCGCMEPSPASTPGHVNMLPT